METLRKIICTLIGHRAYSKEVLSARPWEYADLGAIFAPADFREPACLRCGQALEA